MYCWRKTTVSSKCVIYCHGIARRIWPDMFFPLRNIKADADYEKFESTFRSDLLLPQRPNIILIYSEASSLGFSPKAFISN